MQINITGHGIEVTEALRKFTTGKFDKLERHFDRISQVHVVFNVEHMTQIAESTIHIPGANIHARSESDDLYSAIDSLIDKLDRQLIKHKEKSNDHKE